MCLSADEIIDEMCTCSCPIWGNCAIQAWIEAKIKSYPDSRLQFPWRLQRREISQFQNVQYIVDNKQLHNSSVDYQLQTSYKRVNNSVLIQLIPILWYLVHYSKLTVSNYELARFLC